MTEVMFLIIFFSCCGIFLASSILQIIGYTKRISLMEYICKPVMYLSLIAAAIFALILELPDSMNILICTCTSLGLGMIASCLLFAPKIKKVRKLCTAMYMLSTASWLYLIWPSFKLFYFSSWISALIIFLYISALVLFCVLVVKKQTAKKYAETVLYYLPSLIFHYGVLLTVFGQPKLYSYILISGATGLLAAEGFIIHGFFWKTGTKERFVRMLVFILSQFAITAGFVVMITF